MTRSTETRLGKVVVRDWCREGGKIKTLPVSAGEMIALCMTCGTDGSQTPLSMFHKLLIITITAGVEHQYDHQGIAFAAVFAESSRSSALSGYYKQTRKQNHLVQVWACISITEKKGDLHSLEG